MKVKRKSIKLNEQSLSFRMLLLLIHEHEECKQWNQPYHLFLRLLQRLLFFKYWKLEKEMDYFPPL